MFRFTEKPLVRALASLGILLFALTAILGTSPKAYAASLSPSTKNACKILRAGLRGKSKPGYHCLRTFDQPASLPQGSCQITDLQLFIDAYYGGGEVCFYGKGSTNLDVIPYGFLGNWNDQVSSYKAGNNNGHFSWDNDNGGAVYTIYSEVLCDWIGSYWNDEASYVQITGQSSASQTYC